MHKTKLNFFRGILVLFTFGIAAKVPRLDLVIALVGDHFTATLF